MSPAVFRGYWWSHEKRSWILDEIALFIIDYQLDPQDTEFITHVRELKDTISNSYRRYGSTQEEIWIISHPVLRYI